MTLVFVHGNPETAAIWGPLLEELGRQDVILLSPPGFGAPVPDGFGCTQLEYRDWLAEGRTQPTRRTGGPGPRGAAAAAQCCRWHRPEAGALVKMVGLDPEYVWHDLAQVWATPGAGELIEMLAAPRRARRGTQRVRVGHGGRGLPGTRGEARWAARCWRCVGHSTGARRHLDVATRPGLAIVATEDHFVGTEEMRQRTAARAGARVEVLEGLGHWWMLQDPVRAAGALSRFWADLDPGA